MEITLAIRYNEHYGHTEYSFGGGWHASLLAALQEAGLRFEVEPLSNFLNKVAISRGKDSYMTMELAEKIEDTLGVILVPTELSPTFGNDMATSVQAAKALGLSPESGRVHQLVREGKLEGQTVGGVLYVSRRSIEERKKIVRPGRPKKFTFAVLESEFNANHEAILDDLVAGGYMKAPQAIKVKVDSKEAIYFIEDRSQRPSDDVLRVPKFGEGTVPTYSSIGKASRDLRVAKEKLYERITSNYAIVLGGVDFIAQEGIEEYKHPKANRG